MIDAINIAIGLVVFLFLPGYLLTILLFDRLQIVEKAVLSSVLSIMVGVAIAIFFGYSRHWATKTGGFTTENIWLGEIVINSILVLAVLVKQTFKKKNDLPIERKKKK